MTRLIGFVLLLPIFYVIAIFVASEHAGEVVELETEGTLGRKFTTALWIAELNGDLWLRAGSPTSEWLARLRVDPNVVLIRDGVRSEYRAEVVEGFGPRLNAGLRKKYGWADVVVGTLHDEEEVVAVRLLPP